MKSEFFRVLLAWFISTAVAAVTLYLADQWNTIVVVCFSVSMLVGILLITIIVPNKGE